MKPILYENTETSFTSNGLGRLADCVSCIVTEVRNGLFELELKYPVNGIHFEKIKDGRIIYCTHDASGTPQAFDIYNVSKPNKGTITVKARHISYRLSDIVVMPVAVLGLGAQSMFDLISSESVGTNPFSFVSDVTTAGDMNVKQPSSIRSILGEDENQILYTWGGEYKWDMWTVYHYVARGRDRGVKVRTGKNVKKLIVEGDSSEIVTGVVPWWLGQSDATGDDVYVDLPEKIIQSPDASQYAHQITKPLDMSAVWESEPTVAELRAGAAEWLKRNMYNTRGRLTYAVDMTAFDKETEDLNKILLCDYVTVQDVNLGVDVNLEVVKTVYNVLRERYDKLEIGNLRRTLSYDFRLKNSIIIRRLENTETKTTAAAKTASAAGTESHVEDQLADPTSALSVAIANAGGGGGSGGSRWGGANNAYGVAEDYNANNELIATIDKDGVKVGNNAATYFRVGNADHPQSRVVKYILQESINGYTAAATEASPQVITRASDGKNFYGWDFRGSYEYDETADRYKEQIIVRAGAASVSLTGECFLKSVLKSTHRGTSTTAQTEAQWSNTIGVADRTTDQTTRKRRSLTKLLGAFLFDTPITLYYPSSGNTVQKRGIIIPSLDSESMGDYFAVWLHTEPLRLQTSFRNPVFYLAACDENGFVNMETQTDFTLEFQLGHVR